MSGETIVVIDDAPANLDLLLVLLGSLGYRVIGAPNGILGLQEVERHRPALLLVDVELPDIDGYTILRKLRANAEFHSMPIIAVTAFAMPGDALRGAAAGFDDYLTKPINIEALPKRVERALTARRLLGLSNR
ncbi:response regulator [Duganella sp. FT94W]|uniref:Response regulator n=1 Tax=Duganella lactea TaxID=2692173 RepID=A0ABW9V692_9BURK|nr:response regulator [Duganella lactea]MYM35060.1 response regulator [Duganella lactea]